MSKFGVELGEDQLKDYGFRQSVYLERQMGVLLIVLDRIVKVSSRMSRAATEHQSLGQLWPRFERGKDRLGDGENSISTEDESVSRGTGVKRGDLRAGDEARNDVDVVNGPVGEGTSHDW